MRLFQSTKEKMATLPAQSAARQSGIPLSQAPDEDSAEESGYKICIAVDASGQISVGVEDESSETQGQPEDESTEMSGMSGMTPVGSIKEALTTALDIYKSNGAMQNKSAMNAEFKSGFEEA